MDILPVWSENCAVRFGAVDRSDSITLDAVLGLFQEAAISHAENLGVGRNALLLANQAWVFSRMSVLIDRRSKYGENITVRSWPRGSEKLFAIRDYDIRDESDNAVVRARSCWLVIDVEKRRPLRPDSVVAKMPRNEGIASIMPPDALPASLDDRQLPGMAGAHYTERRALYTDIDYYGHVNNVSYIRWIEDAIDPALLEQAGRMRLDINYLNEVLPGELLVLWSAEINPTNFNSTDIKPTENSGDPPMHTFVFEGRKNSGALPSFRAELKFESFSC